ncbi:MAG TPA: PEP/pyruvate-binding domain-containing protein, partial [Anaerolineales bacterium]|nr:PEP/pyruvate-binding domain-containing protein [Anaerolineales bacterium]
MTILPFTSTEATLQTAGGKGANLARLTRAGFPVPRGFIVSTDDYRAFVSANHLTNTVAAAIANLVPDDAAQLENASAQIRKAFAAGKMPPETERAVSVAYGDLKGAPVAVRSSATAEDLPDLSFAGQQDTYLNIIGAEALLEAVVTCWSSLWTARAIGYRARNGISHDDAALGVVVQAMVQSDVSGVLFTANPLTGLLSESVIDATFGLGEALVSGQVEPDHFVVNSLSGEINEIGLGAKKLSTRGKTGGGVESVVENAEGRQTLSADEVRQLVAVGQSIQKEYGAPQDIEWAFADGRLYLLQSRAITSLFPVPQVSLDPLIVWFSFGAVQGLVGPMTPLGRDAIQNLAAGAGRMFDLRLNPEKVDVLASAGERIWIRMSDVIRHPIGGRIVGELLDFIEPSVGQILQSLIADSRLGARTGRLKFSTLRRLAGFFLPVLVRLARNVLHPDDARARFDAAIDDYLNKAHIAPATDRFGRLRNIVTFIRSQVANAFPFLLPKFIPIFGPSMAGLNLLIHLSGDASLTLEVTRGLPRNVTTEMDLALWETATGIRAEAESASIFRATDATTL